MKSSLGSFFFSREKGSWDQKVRKPLWFILSCDWSVSCSDLIKHYGDGITKHLLYKALAGPKFLALQHKKLVCGNLSDLDFSVCFLLPVPTFSFYSCFLFLIFLFWLLFSFFLLFFCLFSHFSFFIPFVLFLIFLLFSFFSCYLNFLNFFLDFLLFSWFFLFFL